MTAEICDEKQHIRDGRLIRQLGSYTKQTFYHPLPLPKCALNRRWPAADCIAYYRTGEVTNIPYPQFNNVEVEGIPKGF